MGADDDFVQAWQRWDQKSGDEVRAKALIAEVRRLADALDANPNELRKRMANLRCKGYAREEIFGMLSSEETPS